jgi:type VI protein secretion system component VasK
MRSVLGKRILGSVGMLIGAVGVIGVVLAVYLRIRAGHGADAFQNGYGQYETWASYAGLLIAAALILLGIFLVRRWQLWRRSRLEGISSKEILEELKRDL